MFGWKRKSAAVCEPIEAEMVVEEIAESPPSAPVHADLLHRWMSFASIQQRVIRTLVSEIKQTSAVVETEAESLSARFQRLASSADQQTSRVSHLSKLAVGIDVEGEIVPIDRIAGLLDDTLADVVEKILFLSKDAMSMVFALSELKTNVDRVEGCMVELDKINRTTNMLALNARIEAERAGAAGAAFRVVAGEVRELSGATARLAEDMESELNAVTLGIASGHQTLQRVATIDMSQNLLAKERLEVLMAALIRRSENLSSVVNDARQEAATISADVAAVVTGIQFQDRTRQRLEHVVDTLAFVDQALDELKDATRANTVEPSEDHPDDLGWVKKLLDHFTLGELRSRFVAEILEGKQPTAPAADAAGIDGLPASGTIELF